MQQVKVSGIEEETKVQHIVMSIDDLKPLTDQVDDAEEDSLDEIE